MSAWPLPRRARYSPRIMKASAPVGKLGGLAQAGDGADGAELAVDAGHEQDQAAALAGGLDRCLLASPSTREGDRHVGEDDDVVHGEDWQELGAWLGHSLFIPTNPDAYAFPSP